MKQKIMTKTKLKTLLLITITAYTGYALSQESVTDTDGNTYRTITIGSQVWMSENLRTTRYNDGTAIPLVTDKAAWKDLHTPGYCWYNNSQSGNGITNGALYNWCAVNSGKLCPAGWHVPSDSAWTILTDYLGGLNAAGGKLKETGVSHWLSPNAGATNETGFTAIPEGYRNVDGTFTDFGGGGYWWSSTGSRYNNAWSRYMSYNSISIIRGNDDKQAGFSIRCVRD